MKYLVDDVVQLIGTRKRGLIIGHMFTQRLPVVRWDDGTEAAYLCSELAYVGRMK